MYQIDNAVLQFFFNLRVTWLTDLMLVFTYAGSTLIVVLVSALSIASFWIHKHSEKIPPFLIALIGSTLSVYYLKNFLGIPRPESAIYSEGSFSFPSGHTAIAVALYGFLLFTVWQGSKHPLKKPAIWLLGSLILLISLSRLYLGVHYLSDVLTGFFVGGLWLCISISLLKIRGRKDETKFENLK